MLRLLTVLCESSEVDITAETVKNVKYSTRAGKRTLSLSVTVVAILSAILILLFDVITQFRNITPLYLYIF